MTMSKLIRILCAAAALAVPQMASAAVSVGGFSFDNNAFVDVLNSSSGSFSVSGGTLSTVVTDTDPGTFAFSFSQGAFLDLGFTDNVAVNGAGNDIVLFELGAPDRWLVTINGISSQCQSAGTGFSAVGFQLNACGLDLSTFGIASGGTVSSLRLGFLTNNQTIASTSLVGALNSQAVGGAIPEPATWAMLLTGFGLVGATMRRRAAATAA
jgi:hypothetical protein